MKKSIAILIFALIFIISHQLSAQILRIDIKGQLKGASNIDIFHGQLLLPVGNYWEVFTGPYTLKFSAEKSQSGQYDVAVSVYGLGPDYHNEDFKISLSPNDPMIIPPLPVKGDSRALYTFMLLDDTSHIAFPEPDPNDTTKWGITESIHYRTHWEIGSLADFMWNVKMGYLEDIYNKYRGSYDLSSFEKIDLYFHPEPTNAIFINPATHYAIQPRVRRIDLVFGHEIDVADPRPGAELQIYRMWGYGPRWMATGFAGYYFDNYLRVKDYIDKLSVKGISALISDEQRLNSDTAREITGAFAHWLIDTKSATKFENLYKESTALDFQQKFSEAFGQSLDNALGDFIGFIKKYETGSAELGYYAQVYMAQRDYEQASKYYAKILDSKEAGREKFRQSLGMSQFWAGDYKGAERTLNYPSPWGKSDNEEYIIAKILLASADSIKIGNSYYPSCFFHFRDLTKDNYVPAKIDWASMLLDQGKIDSASAILNGMDEGNKNPPDYLLAKGRMQIMRSENADSILTLVASNALSNVTSAPQEPSNYLDAGRALMLLGKYNQAKENLEISNFLENRPYYSGQTLLELGRLMDLEGKRDQAEEYYKDVITINAGAYEKSLARKYLGKKYVIR